MDIAAIFCFICCQSRSRSILRFVVVLTQDGRQVKSSSSSMSVCFYWYVSGLLPCAYFIIKSSSCYPCSSILKTSYSIVLPTISWYFSNYYLVKIAPRKTVSQFESMFSIGFMIAELSMAVKMKSKGPNVSNFVTSISFLALFNAVYRGVSRE